MGNVKLNSNQYASLSIYVRYDEVIKQEKSQYQLLVNLIQDKVENTNRSFEISRSGPGMWVDINGCSFIIRSTPRRAQLDAFEDVELIVERIRKCIVNMRIPSTPISSLLPNYKRPFIMGREFTYIGPKFASPGDEIFDLEGACLLFLLRKVTNKYKVVGECHSKEFIRESGRDSE